MGLPRQLTELRGPLSMLTKIPTLPRPELRPLPHRPWLRRDTLGERYQIAFYELDLTLPLLHIDRRRIVMNSGYS